MMLVKVGDRVKVKGLGIKGTVEHVDYHGLSTNLPYPIQITLDSPYNSSQDPNAYMYRTGLDDLVKLRRKSDVGHHSGRMDKPMFNGVLSPDDLAQLKKEIKRFRRWLETSY